MLVPPGGGGGDELPRCGRSARSGSEGRPGTGPSHTPGHRRLQPHAGPSPWHPALEALKEELVVQDLVPARSQAPTLHKVYLFTKGFKPSRKESFRLGRAQLRGSCIRFLWLQTTENESLTVPEARSPKSRCSLQSLGENPSCLFQLLGAP